MTVPVVEDETGKPKAAQAVYAPEGLLVSDPALDTAGQPTALPPVFDETFSDTDAPTSLVITRTGVGGDTRVFTKTITYHASGRLNGNPAWRQQS